MKDDFISVLILAVSSYFCSVFKDVSTSVSIGSISVIIIIFCSVIVFQCITEPRKCELEHLNLKFWWLERETCHQACVFSSGTEWNCAVSTFS